MLGCLRLVKILPTLLRNSILEPVADLTQNEESDGFVANLCHMGWNITAKRLLLYNYVKTAILKIILLLFLYCIYNMT